MNDKRTWQYTAKAKLFDHTYTITAIGKESLMVKLEEFVLKKRYADDLVNSYQLPDTPFIEGYCKTIIFPEIKWTIERHEIKYLGENI